MPGGRVVLLNEYLFSNSLTPGETRTLFLDVGFSADVRDVALPDDVPMRQKMAVKAGAPPGNGPQGLPDDLLYAPLNPCQQSGSELPHSRDRYAVGYSRSDLECASLLAP